MGADLPRTRALIGATHRSRSNGFVVIRPPPSEGDPPATCEPVGSLRVGQRGCQPGRTTMPRARRMPYSRSPGRGVAGPYGAQARSRTSLTIGRTGEVAFHWRRSTTLNPADSNIGSGP